MGKKNPDITEETLQDLESGFYVINTSPKSHFIDYDSDLRIKKNQFFEVGENFEMEAWFDRIKSALIKDHS